MHKIPNHCDWSTAIRSRWSNKFHVASFQGRLHPWYYDCQSLHKIGGRNWKLEERRGKTIFDDSFFSPPCQRLSWLCQAIQAPSKRIVYFQEKAWLALGTCLHPVLAGISIHSYAFEVDSSRWLERDSTRTKTKGWLLTNYTRPSTLVEPFWMITEERRIKSWQVFSKPTFERSLWCMKMRWQVEWMLLIIQGFWVW